MKKSLFIFTLGIALGFGSVYAQSAAPNPAVAAAQAKLAQSKAALAKAQADATSANNSVKIATDAVAQATNDLSAAQAAASKPAAQPEPAAPTASTAPTGIKVLMAAYGRNCKAPKPDVMAHLAAACNGKSACTYTVDHKLIGDTARGCAKDYVVDYVCAAPNVKPVIRKTGVAPEASGKTVQLVCDTAAPAAAPAAPTAQQIALQAKQKACLDMAKTQEVKKGFMNLFMDGCMAPPNSQPRAHFCNAQARSVMHLTPATMGSFVTECTARP